MGMGRRVEPVGRHRLLAAGPVRPAQHGHGVGLDIDDCIAERIFIGIAV
ncbi:hypothetical protein SDC9_206858 [bioreactor metagenome]|uniref:Uncharacterized protein n=1 Tax=bioreactor metagenome TaxID=1076179 RepID=A0A645J8V8_9ZZZZ